jgi:hypothetical protein
MPHRNQFATPKVKDIERPLDITRPFMDDTGRPGIGGAQLAGLRVVVLDELRH